MLYMSVELTATRKSSHITYVWLKAYDLNDEDMITRAHLAD